MVYKWNFFFLIAVNPIIKSFLSKNILRSLVIPLKLNPKLKIKNLLMLTCLKIFSLYPV